MPAMRSAETSFTTVVLNACLVPLPVLSGLHTCISYVSHLIALAANYSLLLPVHCIIIHQFLYNKRSVHGVNPALVGL